MTINPEDAISMMEVGQKLQTPEQFLPGREEVFYGICKYFGERLGDRELHPLGFIMESQLTAYDLNKGVSGWTGKPVPAHLTGYPSLIYTLFTVEVPEIAKAVCPEDFAAKVETAYEEISRRMG